MLVHSSLPLSQIDIFLSVDVTSNPSRSTELSGTWNSAQGCVRSITNFCTTDFPPRNHQIKNKHEIAITRATTRASQPLLSLTRILPPLFSPASDHRSS